MLIILLSIVGCLALCAVGVLFIMFGGLGESVVTFLGGYCAIAFGFYGAYYLFAYGILRATAHPSVVMGVTVVLALVSTYLLHQKIFWKKII